MYACGISSLASLAPVFLGESFYKGTGSNLRQLFTIIIDVKQQLVY